MAKVSITFKAFHNGNKTHHFTSNALLVTKNSTSNLSFKMKETNDLIKISYNHDYFKLNNQNHYQIEMINQQQAQGFYYLGTNKIPINVKIIAYNIIKENFYLEYTMNLGQEKAGSFKIEITIGSESNEENR
ncbi:MAG: hypothetical protein ACRCTA_05020 [Bacilli bacterium]